MVSIVMILGLLSLMVVLSSMVHNILTELPIVSLSLVEEFTYRSE